MPALLERDEQLAGAGQQRDLVDQRVDLLALPLARLVADPLLDARRPPSAVTQLVAAHADQPVDPPDRERLPQRPERPVPGQRVLVVGVDEGAVDVEDGDALRSSPARPLPTIRADQCRTAAGVLEQAADGLAGRLVAVALVQLRPASSAG